VPEEKVCCACLIKLKETPIEVTIESHESAITSSDATQGQNYGSTDTESSVMSVAEFSSPEKNVFTDINAVLIHLDETPVKTRSLGQSSRKSKGKQKLKRGKVKLKLGLEELYNTQLDSAESENQNLQLFNSMFLSK